MPARTTSDDVFINCPFDDGYSEIFRALIFTIYACGFRPRSAREIDDGGQTRIEKLLNIMNECRYGIHDLSRTELDRVNKLPRFNMPLELGIFLGAKHFGGKAHKLKRLLILDVKPHRYQKFISDLAGMDIHSHNGQANNAIAETRDWLATVSRRVLPGGAELRTNHRKFRRELPKIAQQLGFADLDIPYVDFERILIAWLKPR